MSHFSASRASLTLALSSGVSGASDLVKWRWRAATAFATYAGEGLILDPCGDLLHSGGEWHDPIFRAVAKVDLIFAHISCLGGVEGRWGGLVWEG